MRGFNLFFLGLLWCFLCYSIEAAFPQDDDFPVDDNFDDRYGPDPTSPPLTWIDLNSDNAGTWDKLLDLCDPNNAEQAFGFRFTEDIIYNPTDDQTIYIEGYLAFEVNPGVTVTINIPKKIASLFYLDTGAFAIAAGDGYGDLIFQGLGEAGLEIVQIAIYGANGNLYIDGGIFQNIYNNGDPASSDPYPAIKIFATEVYLTNTIFRNIGGNVVSAIYSANTNPVIVDGVIVENCFVTEPIYTGAANVLVVSMEGNITFTNNTGTNFICDSVPCNINCDPDNIADDAEYDDDGNSPPNWTEVTSENGATWTEFYDNVFMGGEGTNAFVFTEDVTYDVIGGFQVNRKKLSLKVNPGVTVTMNLTNMEANEFISQDGGYIEIFAGEGNGDLIITGPGQSCETCSYKLAFFIPWGTFYMEGGIINNFGCSGALNIEGGTVTLIGTTFKDNYGTTASAIYNELGILSLNDVIIEDNTITSKAVGGQIYNYLKANCTGTAKFSNNVGPDYVCAPQGLCSIDNSDTDDVDPDNTTNNPTNNDDTDDVNPGGNGSTSTKKTVEIVVPIIAVALIIGIAIVTFYTKQNKKLNNTDSNNIKKSLISLEAGNVNSSNQQL